MSKSLQDWLDWQETLHPSEIDLGLQRVAQVLHRLLESLTCNKESSTSMSSTDADTAEQFNPPFTVITIAGTNGKGSTVAMLESIFTEAGYQVGSYTSPHLLQYNERIKINTVPVSDALICDSFERIDTARNDISLTYFEFGTLAAIDIFHQQLCDIVILEVGLGGRLDAVNVIDADVALVTTVDIDHQDWLGSDKETIAIEKAGIYRQNKPAIYGDSDCPQSILHIVEQQKLTFYQYSADYQYEVREQQWDWLSLPVDKKNESDNKLELFSRYNLPLPNLQGAAQLKNAANVLMVLDLLKQTCPVTQAEIKRGFQSVQLPGRFQVVSTDPIVVLDVAHNVQATEVLRMSLESLNRNRAGKLHVIVGMLNDKDVSDVISVLEPIVDSWRVIELDTPRAMPASVIQALLTDVLSASEQSTGVVVKKIQCFSNFEQAYQDFCENNLLLNTIDTLLVFGSFFTVTDALHFFNLQIKNNNL